MGLQYVAAVPVAWRTTAVAARVAEDHPPCPDKLGQSAASSRAKKKIDFSHFINPRGGDEASVVDASLAGGTF